MWNPETIHIVRIFADCKGCYSVFEETEGVMGIGWGKARSACLMTVLLLALTTLFQPFGVKARGIDPCPGGVVNHWVPKHPQPGWSWDYRAHDGPNRVWETRGIVTYSTQINVRPECDPMYQKAHTLNVLYDSLYPGWRYKQLFGW